jgi:hypothetical protein
MPTKTKTSSRKNQPAVSVQAARTAAPSQKDPHPAGVRNAAPTASEKTAQKSGARNAVKRSKKCRARDVGHRSCDCGGPYCGANVTYR